MPNWKKEIVIWQLATTLPEEKQTASIFLTLTGRDREAVLQMSTDNIGSKERVTKLFAKLDELYQVDKNQSDSLVYIEFEQFKRHEHEGRINTFDPGL